DAAPARPQGREDRGRRRGRRPRARQAAPRRGQGPVTTVLAVCEQRDGALRKVSSEVVTGARRIADALGGGAEVEALVLGSGPASGADQLGSFGADRVVTLTADRIGQIAPPGYDPSLGGCGSA